MILALATSRKSDDCSQGLDACLVRHAHACTRVTALRTVWKTGGRRCRRVRERERSRKERKEEERGGSSNSSSSGGGNGDEGGGEGGAGGSKQKGAPSSEATVRTRRGIASHTGPSAGTGPDRDRNSPDPRALGPRCRGPCSRQRQRQARASHATRTRPSRPSREHKPRFFHPRRYLPLPPPPPHLSPPPPPPPLLAAVTAALCHQPPSRVSVLFSAISSRYRDGPRSR